MEGAGKMPCGNVSAKPRGSDSVQAKRSVFTTSSTLMRATDKCSELLGCLLASANMLTC